jgi:hypothetical protein
VAVIGRRRGPVTARVRAAASLTRADSSLENCARVGVEIDMPRQ